MHITSDLIEHPESIIAAGKFRSSQIAPWYISTPMLDNSGKWGVLFPDALSFSTKYDAEEFAKELRVSCPNREFIPSYIDKNGYFSADPDQKAF